MVVSTRCCCGQGRHACLRLPSHPTCSPKHLALQCALVVVCALCLVGHQFCCNPRPFLHSCCYPDLVVLQCALVVGALWLV